MFIFLLSAVLLLPAELSYEQRRLKLVQALQLLGIIYSAEPVGGPPPPLMPMPMHTQTHEKTAKAYGQRSF